MDENTKKNDFVTVVCRVPKALIDRAMKYIPERRALNTFVLIALEEWVTRHEGRDKRAQAERIAEDEKAIIEIMNRAIKEGRLKV